MHGKQKQIMPPRPFNPSPRWFVWSRKGTRQIPDPFPAPRRARADTMVDRGVIRVASQHLQANAR